MCLLSLNTPSIPPHTLSLAPKTNLLLEAVATTTAIEAHKWPIGGKSWFFQPSKKFLLQPTYPSAALGDSKAQRLCLWGKILSRQPEETLNTIGLDPVRILTPTNGWARTSSDGQGKLLIFLRPVQCTWRSVLPNHFSSTAGSSVTNALLLACICHWLSQLRQKA